VAPVDHALTTQSAVSGYSSDTDLLDRAINEATDLFAKLVGRDVHWRAGHTEKVAGDGSFRLEVFEALPIDTVNSITHDNGVTSQGVDSATYRIESAEDGFIERIGRYKRWIGTDGRNFYTVDYDGGWVTPQQASVDGTLTRDLPYDIERAAIEFVVMRVANDGADPTVKRVGVDQGSISYVTVNGRKVDVPQSFADAAENYRHLRWF
jgi:hypothetical protein